MQNSVCLLSYQTRYVTLIPKGSEDTTSEQKPTEDKDKAVEEQGKDEVNEIHVETKVQAATTTDDQLTKDFFNGDYCLQGVSLPLKIAYSFFILHSSIRFILYS